MKTRLILVSSTVLLLTACMNKTQEKANMNTAEISETQAEGQVNLPDEGLPYKPISFIGESIIAFRKTALFVEASVRLLRSNGSEGKSFDGKAVFMLERRFVSTKAMKNTLKMVMSDPDSKEVMDTKYGSRPVKNQKDGKTGVVE